MANPVRIEDVIGMIDVLHLDPGDKLVFSTDEHLSLEATRRVKEQMKRLCPNVECIVVERARLEVLRA